MLKMKNENNIILMPGQHTIYLKKGTEITGYSELQTKENEYINNLNIISPKVMLPDHIHLNDNYILYINTQRVIIKANQKRQNIPGIPEENFDQIADQEIIMFPHQHQITLPYRESITDINDQNVKQTQEITHHYAGYRAISKESDFTYPYGRSLWSDGEDPYISYKLYENSASVAVLVKNIDKNIPGKTLVKQKNK